MNGSVVALAREHGRTEPDKAALDFIEGRITRGEFNRKRRDILEQTDQQVQLVARELIASAACFSTHHRLAFDGVLLFFERSRTPGTPASSVTSMPSASNAALTADGALDIVVRGISPSVSMRSTV